MAKGGQKLMEMAKRKAPDADMNVSPPPSSPVIPESPYYYDPEEAALAETLEEFEVGYVSPQEKAAIAERERMNAAAQPSMNAGQLLENIRNFEMPPPDPREEKINTINDKMDVLMDTFRQTLEAQKARQDADEMARQDAAESRGPIDVGYDPKAGRSQNYPADYGNIQAPPPPPAPAPEQPPAPAPEPVPVRSVDLYSYELSPVEIVKLGTNVPNDKILSAPVYDSFEEMNADFNDALNQGFPLPPVVFAAGREVVVAEMEQLKRFVMSADDIKMYNLMIVDETAKEYQQLEE